MMAKSQREKVLEHLKAGATISQYEAIMEYSAFRLSSIIYDLRQQGYNIKTNMVQRPTGKRLAEYKLEGACN